CDSYRTAAHTYTNPNGYRNSHSYRHSDCYPNSHSYRHSDCYVDSYGHTYCYAHGHSCQSLEPLHPPPGRDRRQCHDRWLYHYRKCGQAGGSTRPRPIAVEVWPYRFVAQSGPTVTRGEWERALHER